MDMFTSDDRQTIVNSDNSPGGPYFLVISVREDNIIE